MEIIRKIIKKIENIWDKIEETMEYINKNGFKWALENEWKIYRYSLILTGVLMALAYYYRGYGAVGGEVLVPLIPFGIINYLKWSE